MKKIFNSRLGFTLIELLLYVGLAALILLGVSVFLSLVLGARVKNQTIAEVEQQGVMAIQLITQTMRNATQINSPTPGSSASSLSLNVTDAAKTPTVFAGQAGILRITQGTALPVAITSPKLIASSVSFQNLSRSGTKGVMRIIFTLTHVNSQGVNIYDYSQTFYGSATLR